MVAARESSGRSTKGSGDEFFDQELTRVLHSLPVPVGLGQRVAHNLRQAVRTEADTPSVGGCNEPLAGEGHAQASLPSGEDDRSSEVAESSAELAISSGEEAVLGNQKRRVWDRRLAFASFISAAVLLLAIYFLVGPLSSDQLAAYCRSALEPLDHPTAVWQPEPPPNELWQSLEHFRPARSARLVGWQALPDERFGKGTVWKFTAGGEPFYVMRFTSAPLVAGLTSQLMVIDDQSGGWSLAACTDGENLIVLAVEGELKLESPRLASGDNLERMLVALLPYFSTACAS